MYAILKTLNPGTIPHWLLSHCNLLPILCIEKPAYTDLHHAISNIEAISHDILYDFMVQTEESHSEKRNMNEEEIVFSFYNQYPILFEKKIVERKFLSSYLGVGKDFITKTLAKHGIII